MQTECMMSSAIFIEAQDVFMMGQNSKLSHTNTTASVYTQRHKNVALRHELDDACTPSVMHL